MPGQASLRDEGSGTSPSTGPSIHRAMPGRCMDRVHLASIPAFFFCSAGRGHHCSLGDPTWLPLGGGEGKLLDWVRERMPRATAGIDAQPREMGVISTPCHMREKERSGWAFVLRQSSDAGGGGRSPRGTAAAEIGDGRVRRVAVGSFLWSYSTLVVPPDMPFCFVCCVIPVSGVGDRSVTPSHREEQGQCQS